MSRRWRRSTSNPEWAKKSAPRMATGTSATMNGHECARRRPRFSCSRCRPYVVMGVWLTADSCSDCLSRRPLTAFRGSSETTDHESTRSRKPVWRSCTRRRFSSWGSSLPGTAWTDGSVVSFPRVHRRETCMVARRTWQQLRSGGENSSNLLECASVLWACSLEVLLIRVLK